MFARLVRAYSPRLEPHLRRYSENAADAHDLLQEVWLRAYRKRHTFAARGSFFGWLLMVARTVGIGAVRDRRHAPPVDTVDVGRIGSPDDAILRHALREAILTLPERQREVVMLRLVEGRSTLETARILGCAEGTVKATLHHATRRLQELLKETV